LAGALREYDSYVPELLPSASLVTINDELFARSTPTAKYLRLKSRRVEPSHKITNKTPIIIVIINSRYLLSITQLLYHNA